MSQHWREGAILGVGRATKLQAGSFLLYQALLDLLHKAGFTNAWLTVQ
jgi:hypothetical protein